MPTALTRATATALEGLFDAPGAEGAFFDQGSAAYIEFPSIGGGQEFAVRLISDAIYQVALLEDNTTHTWESAAHTSFALGFHVDHFGPAGENAGVFYNDRMTVWTLLDSQFSPPSGQEITIYFNFAEREFKVLDAFGNTMYATALPASWGNANNPNKWWFIGDHWTDNIYTTAFQLLEICYR